MKRKTKIYFVILIIVSILLFKVAPGEAQTTYQVDLCKSYLINDDGSAELIETQTKDKLFILTADSTKLLSVVNQRSDVYTLEINHNETSPEEIVCYAIPPSGNKIYLVINTEDGELSFSFDGEPQIMLVYRKKRYYD